MPESCPAAAGSPEKVEHGLPEVNLTGFWVGRAPHLTRDPLGLKTGVYRAHGGAVWPRRVCTAGHRRRAACRDHWVAYGSKI